MKTSADMVEGPEAWQRFQAGMRKAISVPSAEIKKRVEEQRKQAQANPNKRGPKRKVKPSASHGPAS
ncbi:MAG TPA: hypothetical protein VGN17_01035 [Bryobacteraceae bacterium]|jgi:hypothetical protein